MHDFGVVSGDEGKHMTTDFGEVRKGRFVIVPKLVRCFAFVHICTSEVGKVGGGCTEFIPHVERRPASRTHGTCLIH